LKAALLFIMMLLATSVSLSGAAPPPTTPTSDAVFQHPLNANQLRELTVSTAQSLAGARTIRGRFTQIRHLRDLPQPLESRGEFLFVRGFGIEWRTTSPFPNRLIVTANGVKQDNGDGKSINNGSSTPALKTLARIFFGLFSLDFESLQRDFSTYGHKQQDLWRVGLKARRANLARAFGALVLAGRTSAESVVLLDAEGNRTEIALHDLQYGSDAPTAGELALFR
jgi:hypothetical protein